MRLDSLQVHQDVLSHAVLLTGPTLDRHTVADVVEAHGGSLLLRDRIFGDDSLCTRPILTHVLSHEDVDRIVMTLHLTRISPCRKYTINVASNIFNMQDIKGFMDVTSNGASNGALCDHNHGTNVIILHYLIFFLISVAVSEEILL